MTGQVSKQAQKNHLTNSDPNALQAEASDPAASSWVGASAGTGKTKVLTDRVLRLLLPRPDGREASDPARILCLTFTKAAAAEMALRINKTLAGWAVMSDAELDKKLKELTGMMPDESLRDAARRLFGQVIDVPGGLKIMTLHAFCQSVLSRFPLEAGISPNFEILDDSLGGELMQTATLKVLQGHDEKALDALNALTELRTENQISDQLKALNSERAQLLTIFEQYPSDDVLKDAIAETYGISENMPQGSAIEAACNFETLCENRLWALCRGLFNGTSTVQKLGKNLQDWLEQPADKRVQIWLQLKQTFLTKEGKVRSTTSGFPKDDPTVAEQFVEIAEKIQETEDTEKAIVSARATYHLLTLGRAVQENFAAAKAWRGLLDYEDLIRLTRDLLAGKTTTIEGERPSDWVLFKLDGGIDHVLIDEAQDTNPEQWEIIQHLTTDFFEGMSARSEGEIGILRTIFVVGDDKQSIFSFQRADPDKFHAMRMYFQEKIERAELEFRPIPLNTSFRSTDPVLRMVNTLFNTPQGRATLGVSPNEDIAHYAHRSGFAGRVDLWPLCEPPEEDQTDEEGWRLPISERLSETPKARLCRLIAEQITQFLSSGGYWLESKNRAARPGDVMILLRRRKDFAAPLIRELKQRSVPVSGLDRMVLSKELAVEDMLTLADFALLPEDDLALACLLRSPLVDMSEEDLFILAHPRGKERLWQALKRSGPADIVEYCENLVQRAGALRPYDFYAGLLHNTCPADKNGSAYRAIQYRLGSDALDPLEEFLNAALNYERTEIPTLQGFVHWQKQNLAEIKRDQEEAGDQVRIMTVHGSKGLQAPIVYLPDTVLTSASKSEKTPKPLWPNRTGLDVPIWTPAARTKPEIYERAADKLTAYEEKEYQRLLYVALTRAEDHLVIAGAKSKQAVLPESWYEQCAAAFRHFDDMSEKSFSPWNKAGNKERKNAESITFKSITSAQTAAPKEDGDQAIKKVEISLPGWTFVRAAEEPDPPRPLTPSRPSQPDQPVASPKKLKEDDYRFQRGRLTHKLLEHLPDIPPENRQQAAETFLAHAQSDLSGNILKEILGETLAILNDPAFAPIFGPNSVAEVPISGFSGKTKLINGQIDRLLVTDKEILIIDYKTNRPPPKKAEDVPQLYRDQLKGYRDILSQIYPDRPVKSALIWTDGPRLMDMTGFLSLS